MKTEYRVVDGAGVPYDEGMDLWPIYEKREDAEEVLRRARESDPDLNWMIEQRVVPPWERPRA